MTTPLDPSRAHAAAIHDLATAGVPADWQTHLGEVTVPDADLTYPHLIVWPPPATRPVTTLAGYAGEITTTTQVTAVGRTHDEVLAALDRVGQALHRRRPVIDGRECGLITHVASGAVPQRSESLRTPEGRPTWYSFALFSLFSSPVRPEGTH